MEEIDSVETEKFCSEMETFLEDEKDQRRYKRFKQRNKVPIESKIIFFSN